MSALNITLLFIFLVLFIFPIFFILLIKKSVRKNMFELLNINSKTSPFSRLNKYKMGSTFVFAPHPFTNWALNPNYRNKYNQLVHTSEGFRKTNPENSIYELLKKYPDTYKIVCIGGSTTHGQDMEYFEDTWPGKLQKKLGNDKFLVFNFSVGAWGSLQSSIRCQSWLPIIKPNLLLFYQDKNDLTPLRNATLNEKNIHPDYQNVYGQFSASLLSKYPKITKYIPLLFLIFYLSNFRRKLILDGLYSIYKPEPENSKVGLERLNEDIIESIVFRKELIFNMCKNLDCKVLYIPEILREPEYVKALKNKIYPKLKKIITKYENVSWHELEEYMPYEKEYFWDHMHFTKEGHELFANVIEKKIKEVI